MKNLLLSGIFCLLIFSLAGCEDDAEPVVNEEEYNPPVANAGPDLEGNVGSEMWVNGSGSEDPDEDELSYSWEMTSQPENSSIVLTDENVSSASFIPNEAGTYTILLTVSDGELTDTDEVLVEITGEPLETIAVNSNIDEETVWSDIFSDPAIPDYLVERSIDINALLTVEPGVVVHLEEDVVMTVESGGGALIAEGEEDNKVVFTSSNEAGEVRWGGLLINSSSTQNSLNQATVAYAGGTDDIIYANGWRGASIGIGENAKIAINNTNLHNSEKDGIFLLRSGSLISFENNEFHDNEGFPLTLSINHIGDISNTNVFTDDDNTTTSENIIRVYDSKLDKDQEWSALHEGAAIRFEGDASIEANLTINEGVIMEFDEDVLFEVTEDGVLKALGTEDMPVVFTSSNVNDGINWSGIVIKSGSVNNELDHVQVSHAGGEENFYYSGWRAVSVGLADNARLKLTNSEISNSEDFGVFLYNTAAFQAFENNSFHNNSGYPVFLQADMAGMIDEGTTIENNTHDVVAIYQSSFTDDAQFRDEASPQWLALTGEAKYLATGDLTVEDDLQLAEGLYLAFSDNILLNVKPSGSLKAVGTADQQIMLTAYERDGNHNWKGINIESANSNNQIKHAEVSYGGVDEASYINGWRKANIGVINEASLDISTSRVSNSKGNGIVYGSSSEVSIADDVNFSDNAGEDVLVP